MDGPGSQKIQKRSESSESLASDQSDQSDQSDEHDQNDQNDQSPPAEGGQQSSQSPAPESPKSDEHGVSHQKSAPHDVPILLNIYDVTHYAGVQWLNALFANQYSPVKFGGIFHIGVQIGQKEWSYGYKADGTGVFWTPPLFQAAHHFRESVRMAPTKLSKRRIASVITELEAEWTGRSYNVFGRNCCHFADALCQRLDIGRVPEWTCRDLSHIVMLVFCIAGVLLEPEFLHSSGHWPMLDSPCQVWPTSAAPLQRPDSPETHRQEQPIPRINHQFHPPLWGAGPT